MEVVVNKRRVFVFLPDSLQRDRIGFLEGFSGKCEDTQAFFVLKEKLNEDSVDSIGYVSEVTPENGKILENKAEWVHVNIRTGEVKICGGGTDVEYCVTCIRYDYEVFVQSDAVLLAPHKYGVYFQTLVRSIKSRSFKKHTRRNAVTHGLLFILLKLFSVFTNLFNEVNDFLHFL